MHRFPLLLALPLGCTLLTAAPARADILTRSVGLGVAPILDFENSPLGIQQGTEWQASTGITVNGVLLYVADLFNPFGPDFVVEGASGQYLGGEAGAELVTLTFDAPQTAFAMAWGTNPGTSMVVAYLGGVAVDQATLSTSAIDPSTAFLVVEGVEFDRIEIDITPDNPVTNAFAIDNIQLAGPAPAIGSSFCTSAPNSVSATGSTISATGSASLSAGSLTLHAEDVPDGLGIFFFGPTQASVRFGNGIRCVGGTLVRMPVVPARAGSMTYTVDLSTYSADLAALGMARFQAWFRDPAAGGSAFNLSDGLEIQFLP